MTVYAYFYLLFHSSINPLDEALTTYISIAGPISLFIALQVLEVTGVRYCQVGALVPE